MLSVLIPIYNYKVEALVTSLSNQAKELSYPIELICFDDGSGESYLAANEVLSTLPNTTYKVLPNNLGRAAIRNALASVAEYDKLLFLDCDSGIVKEDFLQCYLDYHDHPVVIGGRIYPTEQPVNSLQILHWKYGTVKESRPLSERQSRPYIYFHSNNFVIDKQLFLSIQFDEQLKGYGYEDLVFAQALKNQNIKIKHIANPVSHLHIEDNTAFLTKTKNAVRNLRQLNQRGIHLNSKLEIAAKRLKRFGVVAIYKKLYKFRAKEIRKNLLSEQPNMRFLDYYKLYNYLD